MNFQPPDPVCSKCGAEMPPCDCDYEAEKTAEQKREKLRELCNLVKIARQQKNSDPDIYTAVQNFHDEIDASHVLALLDHIDALKGRLAKLKPVDAILVDDCDEGSDKRYGRVLVSTENCIRTLYRNMAFDAAIASAPEVK